MHLLLGRNPFQQVRGRRVVGEQVVERVGEAGEVALGVLGGALVRGRHLRTQCSSMARQWVGGCGWGLPTGPPPLAAWQEPPSI